MPKREVEHGNSFTNIPSSNRESVCAATLTVKIYFVGATPNFWQVSRHAAGKVGLFMEWKRAQPETRTAALITPMRTRAFIGYGLASFFTSTLELRPLWSYFSRRAVGKSSGVPSLKPPLDWK